MADIAEIGFAADTSGLVKAEGALNALKPAAASAQQASVSVAKSLNAVSAAASGVTNTTTATSKAIAVATGAITAQKNAVQQLTPANNNATNSNNAHAASHKGLSTQAMAAQHSIRSMVEQLAMGVPVTQVFSTQLNHLSYAATGPGGIKQAFSDAFGALSKLISGWTIATAAVLALAAGFALSIASVIKSTLALDELSKSTDVTISKLHGLQQAASFKGISTEDFTKGMTGFAQSVYDAQRNMGSLNGLMIANGKSAKDFQGYLGNVADLVARTTSDMQKQKILREAGLPSDAEWVRFMSQGAAGIAAATAESVKFNASAEMNLIKKAHNFDDAWNKATTKMVQYFKSAVVDIASALSNVTIPDWMKTVAKGAVSLIPIVGPIANIAGASGKSTPSFDDRFGKSTPPSNASDLQSAMMKKISGNKADPKTQAELLAANQQAQARISILGDLATVDQLVTLKQKELNAATLQGVGVSSQMEAKILNATRAQAEQSRVMQQAQIGVFDLATAQKAANDTLQMWIDKGLVNKSNAEQMAAAQLVLTRNIQQTAEAAAVAAAPLQQLKQLQLDGSNFAKLLDTGVTGALNGMVTPIQDVLNGITSLGQGFKNIGLIIVKAIQEMMIKMLIITPIAKALMSILNPFAGIFGGASGAITLGTAGGPTPFPSALGNVFANDNVQKFANGGAFTNQVIGKPTIFQYANGAAFGQMGEKGPEAVMPLTRGPNGSLGVQMYGQQANDNGSMQINYMPTYQLGGSATQEDIANLKRQDAKNQAEFVQKVGLAVNNLRKRNVRV